MRTVYGMILSGGTGSRFGSDIPKQFANLCGRPVISYSYEAMKNTEAFDRIIIVSNKNWIKYTEELLPGAMVVAGDDTRTGSLMKGVLFIKNNLDYDDDTIIVSHDGARPFLSDNIIYENIQKIDSYPAVTTVLEMTDSLVKSQDSLTVDASPDRSAYYRVQTPQSFKMNKFLELMSLWSQDDFDSITEISKIFIAGGCKVGMVSGSNENIKITSPKDLAIAETLVKCFK